jgi:dienelactone hydrolase
MRSAGVGVLAALVVGLLAPIQPVAAHVRTRDPIAQRYAVGVRVLPLEDSTRATPADPEGQTPVLASATRVLPTTIYYPAHGEAPSQSVIEAGNVAVADARAAAGPFPVVLFSHGAPGTPHDYASILERWAREGYVVVAPTYPVTSIAGPTDVGYADQREQVRDARFVLDRVLELNHDPESAGGLDGLLDETRIGVAGHSMGGLTTLALVSDCCRDRRVKAALVLAGVSRSHGGPPVRHPMGPILFAHGRFDIAVPFTDSARAYAGARIPKYLLEIRFPIAGILGHLLPFFPAAGRLSSSVARVLDDFLAGYLRGDRSARPALVTAARSRKDFRLRLAR